MRKGCRSPWFCLVLITMILFGCAATGPNRPYAGTVPDSFHHLAQLNQLLSHAWHFKLPALSETEIEAVLHSLSDKTLKEQYLSDRQTFTNEQIQHFLLIEYRTNKAAFSKKAYAVT